MVLQSDGQVSSMSISEAQQQGYSLTTTAHRVVLRSQYKQPHAELIMVGNHGGRKELHGFCITNTFNEKLATTDWRNTLRALPDGVLYNTNMFSKLCLMHCLCLHRWILFLWLNWNVHLNVQTSDVCCSVFTVMLSVREDLAMGTNCKHQSLSI